MPRHDMMPAKGGRKGGMKVGSRRHPVDVPENAGPEAQKAQKAPRQSLVPWNGEDLRKKLQLYDRGPFMELLAMFMECTPSRDAIEKFADQYPDRFIGAMAQLSRIAGFTERTESVTLHLDVSQLSDSQLEDKMREMQARMGNKTPRALLDLKVDDSNPAK